MQPSDLDPAPSSEQTLTLHAERAEITRRTVATASVEVARRTVERPETLHQELFDERVDITRVPINQIVTAMPAIREDGDLTIIPIVEEILVVEKRLMLKEEIHLHRIRTARVHTETVTLREQQATITRTALGTEAVAGTE